MPDASRTLSIGTYETVNANLLGHITYDALNRRYRYVKFLDAVTYVRGHVCGLASATTYAVSNDVAGGSVIGGTGLRFAGVLPYYKEDGSTLADVPTQNQGGYVLVTGFHPFIKTNGDDDIAACDTLIMVATDGVCDSVANATATGDLRYIGIAAAVDVDADNTVPGFVNCPLW